MTRARSALLVLLLSGPAARAGAADDCLSYEPAVVEVTGKLVRESEDTVALLPDHPLCLNATPGNGLNQGLTGVIRIQVVLDDGSLPPEKLFGARVTAHGRMFGAHGASRDTIVLIADRVHRAP